MLLQFNKLFGPIDAPAGTGGDTAHPASAMDILDELMKDDEEVIDLVDLKDKPSSDKDKKDEEESEDKKDAKSEKITDKDDEEEDEDAEEVDELAELEQELKGPSDEQLELMTPARRKDILKEFPQLFKKFPYLETAYYRDQKFTEIFPTIKEAEQAVTSLQAYTELTSKLKTGDIEQVVTDIKKDEKAFFKMVDNYLPTLAKVSPEAYHHLIGNLIKHTVEEMFGEGNTKNNDSLKNAATILHEFIFGNTKWTPPRPLSQETKPSDNKAENDLAKREREFVERKYNAAQNDISTKVDNAIKATIIQHIDPKTEKNPKGQMTEFVRDAAVSEALKQVEDLISKDTRFKSLLDKLWQNAAEKDFAKAEMDKIKGACISKARTLLPSVIKTARLKALKGTGKRSSEELEQDTDTPAKGKSAAPQSSGKSRSDKSAPRSDESSLDFLMRD